MGNLLYLIGMMLSWVIYKQMSVPLSISMSFTKSSLKNVLKSLLGNCYLKLGYKISRQGFNGILIQLYYFQISYYVIIKISGSRSGKMILGKQEDYKCVNAHWWSYNAQRWTRPLWIRFLYQSIWWYLRI